MRSAQSLSLIHILCDRDHVIAVAGVSKKEYLERRVSPELEEYMQNRMSYPNGDASAVSYTHLMAIWC